MNAPECFDALDAYCWACGAVDGDYDTFLIKIQRLVLCEPHDTRFRCDLGIQWFCHLCLDGRAQMLRPEVPVVRGWFAGARTPGWSLVAWQG